VAALTAIYVDFQCPYSYRAWRWLSLLPDREKIEVRPYSLDGEALKGRTSAGDRVRPWDEGRPSIGLELLALGELAREEGTAAHHAFVDAAFAGVHDHEADLSGLEAWLALGARAGIDLRTYTADSERWRAEVGYWHQEAEDELGVFGTPTLVVDHEHALYCKLGRDIGEVDAATRLRDDLVDLALHPIEELKRTG
jgi:2-hydroxychromene-2-carboxylate isomerase